MVQRDDSAYRLRPRGRRLLPRSGPLGLRGIRRGSADRTADLRYHPTAGSRHRRSAHPRSGSHPRSIHPRGRRGVLGSTLERSGALASLACRGARPPPARSDHALPRLGVGYGQLASLGFGLRGSGRRPIAGVRTGRYPHHHRPEPASIRRRVRPVPVVARGDEVRPLRRPAVADCDELRRGGRVFLGDLRRCL